MLADLDLRCPNLLRLDCTYCRHLSDSAITGLHVKTPLLTSLALSVCVAVGRSGLQSLRGLTDLVLLDLSYTDIEVGIPFDTKTLGAAC